MISVPEYTYQHCVGVQKVKRQEKKRKSYPPPQYLFEASYSAVEIQNGGREKVEETTSGKRREEVWVV